MTDIRNTRGRPPGNARPRDAAPRRNVSRRREPPALDKNATAKRGRPRGRWLKRFAALVCAVVVVLGACYIRLRAGPINVDLVTPWLEEAIRDNIGHDKIVDVGGTQIELVGKIRMAVRLHDVVIRGADHAAIASAPKVEVGLSALSLIYGRLHAQSIKLVDAELAVRVTRDGQVTVSAGNTERPLTARPLTAAAGAGVDRPGSTAGRAQAPSGLLAGINWLDSLSMRELENLNEIGFRNGNLIVDDEQRGGRWSMKNISLTLRRPQSGAVALRLGQEGDQPWSLQMEMGPAENGVRAVQIRANKVSVRTMLLAARLKDLTYDADLPLSGELSGQIGRDGMPTFFRGRIRAGRGHVIDTETPDYPMEIDSAEVDVEWNAARRVLMLPFTITSGANRVALAAQLVPPNGDVMDWQLDLSSGSIELAGVDRSPPLFFNKIGIGLRFDTEHRRVQLTQADVSNGDIRVAVSGAIDYSNEPRLTLGVVAATPMSTVSLKRMWPSLIVPEVREWVMERIGRGTVHRVDIHVNSPLHNLSRKGPPVPEDGLAVDILASEVEVHPVDGMPTARDADLKAHITGRTARVTIGKAIADTQAGRTIAISDFVFEVPDMAPKPSPSKSRFRVEGDVAAAAEVLASDRLSDLGAGVLDPASTKGSFAATVNLAMPVKGELTRADTSYSVNADLTGFAAEKLVMNQKFEANSLKIIANNDGYQVKGDVRINGLLVPLEYRKPAKGDAEVRLQTTLDEASRVRFGVDLSPVVSGPLQMKLNGRIGGRDQTSKLRVECDLAQLKLDNVLPGWVKPAGRPGRATFNVVLRPQSTRLEDIVVDGGSASVQGSLELDGNGDLLNASFPTYLPSEGDKASLKMERGADGVMNVTMLGDVLDGRGFIKSMVSGDTSKDSKGRLKTIDFDLKVKLGAVTGYSGEAMRSVDLRMQRRGGLLKTLALTGKIGRDTPVAADLRGAGTPRGEVINVQTGDAGALLRFADIYTKAYGGILDLSMEPSTPEPMAREGLINMRDFVVKGEAQLDRQAGDSVHGGQDGVVFSALRAEITRENGVLTIRDGVLKGPMIGVTLEGGIDYPGNRVRMNGTFVPLYGINNIMGQIPVVGLLAGGKDQGLLAVTFEVVGTPEKPQVRVNPVSLLLPGVTRKIMEFNTGKTNAPTDWQGQEP
ncbi:MAG: hypothetical protein FWD68_12800 [Alphaproteobacteria bacterium]|nr:hypothetical protein [Alphaproteobacteria bacterium]